MNVFRMNPSCILGYVILQILSFAHPYVEIVLTWAEHIGSQIFIHLNCFIKGCPLINVYYCDCQKMARDLDHKYVHINTPLIICKISTAFPSTISSH